MDLFRLWFVLLGIIATISMTQSASTMSRHGEHPPCLEDKRIGPTSRFVVLGNSTYPGQFPWLVAILRTEPGSEGLCAGSLIDLSTVLTAAHCVVYEGTDIIFDPKKITVVAGDYNLDCRDDTEQWVIAEEIRIHREDRNSRHGDIALIKLSESLKATYAVQPIPLPAAPIPESSGTGEVAGWGSTHPQGQGYSSVLLHAELPIVPCTIQEVPEYREFCAGGNGRDSCNGDSGGSFICRGQGHETYLCGIVSRGQTPLCGEQPGIYTNVYSYVPWITKNRQFYPKPSYAPWIIGFLIVVCLAAVLTFRFKRNHRRPGQGDNNENAMIHQCVDNPSIVSYSSLSDK